ncbi:DUF222 domain-containing protein, partial [Nesterenkonia sp. MY13]
MGKKLSTPEAHSELEAALEHHKRELREQAGKVSRLLAYKELRVEEIEESRSFRKNARIKEIYQECAEFLGVPVPEVRRLMDSVEKLSEKLPETYELYQRGETGLGSVQKINRAIEGIQHRPELMEKLDSELITKARDLNSAELGNWLNQRVPELDTKAYEERYERSKDKHYVAFEPQGDGSTKFHGLISTVAAARIEQMLYAMARNMPRKARGTKAEGPVEERTHTQRMADIFTNALTRGLQGGPAVPPAETASPEDTASRDGQLPIPVTGSEGTTATGETSAGLSSSSNSVGHPADSGTSLTTEPTPGAAVDSGNPLASEMTPGSTGAGAVKIGILIPVKTLTGESDDPAISWDRTWMLPASEARAIAADTSAKHDWYAVGVTHDVAIEDAASTGVGEVLTVTKSRTGPASTTAEDIDRWIAKTDPEANNLLTKTYESRTARTHQRNAVLIRDGQCQTPGCTQPGWSAEIDHKQSYETGGATTGENLQTLCKACRAPRGAVGSSGGERPLPLC